MRGNLIRRWGLVAAIASVLMAATAAVAYAKPSPPPPELGLYGKTYAEWSVSFCQWIMGLHTDENPLNDGDGPCPNTLSGQNGPVLFLVPQGTADPPNVRSLTIPDGRPLFFPIWWWSWDNWGIPEDQLMSMDDLIGIVTWCADHVVVADNFVVVDGITLPNWVVVRAAATGRYRLPADCWWYDLGQIGEAGVYPFAADGFYAMLPPLPPGQHTVRFGGTLDFTNEPGMGFAVYHDMTYVLDVVSNGPAS